MKKILLISLVLTAFTSIAFAAENVSFTEKYGISSEGLILDLDMGDTRSYGTTQDWIDLSGQGNHAIQTTVANQPSIIGGLLKGKAQSFDGVNDYRDCGKGLGRPANWTLMCWINPDVIDVNNCMLGSQDFTGASAKGWLLGTYDTGAGQVIVRFGDDTNAQVVIVDAYTQANYPVGEWVHMAATIDGSFVRYYKNGALISKTAQTEVCSGATYEFSVGRAGEYVAAYYELKGDMGKATAFNRAIKNAEVLKHYNKTRKDSNK